MVMGLELRYNVAAAWNRRALSRQVIVAERGCRRGWIPSLRQQKSSGRETPLSDPSQIDPSQTDPTRRTDTGGQEATHEQADAGHGADAHDQAEARRRGGAGGQTEAAARLAEEARKAAGYVASLSAGNLIQWTIAGLAEKAWERMGLVANPATGKITRDFEDARLAIDAIAALVDLLAPRIEPAGLRHLQALLADLRINYAAQRSRAESAPGEERR